MESNPADFRSIDEYIASFPEATQKILVELRALIHESAPEAQEKISYHMPTFTLKGNLVYFAVFKNHIGLYGASSAVQAFRDELSRYSGPKGALRFPFDQPMPWELIRKIVNFRAEENLMKAEMKSHNRK
jgi:uncharacterized protein YdhG (YjbR/CyaY superfamily)